MTNLTYKECNIGFIKDMISNSSSTFSLFFEGLTPDDVELMFLAKYSDRLISNLIQLIMQIEDAPQNRVTSIITSKFQEKWAKMHGLYSLTYDILKPFTIQLKDTNELDYNVDKNSGTRTNKVDNNYTESNSNDKYYGFNSELGVPVNANDSANTNHSLGTSTYDDLYHKLEKNVREYTRTGNIGNTSFSELIEKERDNLKFIYQNDVLADCASVLLSNIWKT